MLISCILSTYTVAILCSFHHVWLQLDDNWLKPFAFYDSVASESRRSVCAIGWQYIFTARAEINSYYWPWCKPTGNTFQTSSSLAPQFACGTSFTIFPDCFVTFARRRHTRGLSKRALALQRVENRQTEVTVARSLLGEDFAWYVGFFLSPPLLGRQRCSWWILKQISLIIVFHNCHAERDCPLRSYLCHCTPPYAHTTTTSTALPLQTLQ